MTEAARRLEEAAQEAAGARAASEARGTLAAAALAAAEAVGAPRAEEAALEAEGAPREEEDAAPKEEGEETAPREEEEEAASWTAQEEVAQIGPTATRMPTVEGQVGVRTQAAEGGTKEVEEGGAEEIQIPTAAGAKESDRKAFLRGGARTGMIPWKRRRRMLKIKGGWSAPPALQITHMHQKVGFFVCVLLSFCSCKIQ